MSNSGHQCQSPVSFKEYIWLQIEEILGPDNMYFTGLNLGHPPSREEAALNYVERGGAENFAKKFTPEDSSNIKKKENPTL